MQFAFIFAVALFLVALHHLSSEYLNHTRFCGINKPVKTVEENKPRFPV